MRNSARGTWTRAGGGALLAALAALVIVTATATGAGSGPQPFGIRAAHLTQQGRDLRYSVTMAHRFSGNWLHQTGKTICLRIGRPAVKQLCVVPPAAKGRDLRLQLSSISGGGAHVIAASVKRPTPSSLLASFRPAAIGRGYRSFRWQVRSTLTPARCKAAETSRGAGADGSCPVANVPARAALAKLHTPKLVGCVPTGRSLVFGGSTHRHDIALSFDDGPWPDPPSIDFVRRLAHYHVPATFFEIGDEIDGPAGRYDPTGRVERLMLKDGDMIGNHTFTHPDMLTLSPAQQTSQLESTNRAIRRRTGFTPCLWRPPYGDTNSQVQDLARRHGMQTIYWDVDPRDWSLPGVAAIERGVIDKAHNGAIVIMHFGGGPRYETYDALPDIITTLRHRGYHFVNIAQLLHLRMIYR
jgi:peptidoglycan-N-acetylglucosamine deacetylase